MPYQYSGLPSFQENVEQLFQRSTIARDALQVRLDQRIGRVIFGVVLWPPNGRLSDTTSTREIVGAALYSTGQDDDVHIAVGSHRSGPEGRAIRTSTRNYLIGGADYDAHTNSWERDDQIYDQSVLWGQLTIDEMNNDLQLLAGDRALNPLRNRQSREHLRAVLTDDRSRFVEPLLQTAAELIVAGKMPVDLR